MIRNGEEQQSRQILGAWGQFEPVMTPAGRPRGHRRLPLPQRPPRSLRSPRGLLPKLLKRCQGIHHIPYTQQIDWQRININTSAFSWSRRTGSNTWAGGRPLGAGPGASAGHFDKQITVTTPLQRAGAYFVTARMDGGNTSNIVVWLDDTVIVKKPVSRLDIECVLFRRRFPHRPAGARGRCRAFRLADGAG